MYNDVHLIMINNYRKQYYESYDDNLMSWVRTVISDITPFWFRKCVLSLTNPLLHTRRNGSSTITIEWGIPTQPNERNSENNNGEMIERREREGGREIGRVKREPFSYSIYIITPIDHISHDRSYVSGPNTSGAKLEKQ